MLFGETCEESLMQCRDIIDGNLIISKTDTRGIITYANDKFCEISGYSKDELIGQPHNIVRSPNMQAEAFAEMWKDIFAKKTWKGRIENRKKDGSFYTVDSIVAPILGTNNEIMEFVAIRNDVTEIVNMEKALLEEKQKKERMELKNEMLESVARAKDIMPLKSQTINTLI